MIYQLCQNLEGDESCDSCELWRAQLEKWVVSGVRSQGTKGRGNEEVKAGHSLSF